jgi:hypothetical protein
MNMKPSAPDLRNAGRSPGERRLLVGGRVGHHAANVHDPV